MGSSTALIRKSRSKLNQPAWRSRARLRAAVNPGAETPLRDSERRRDLFARHWFEYRERRADRVGRLVDVLHLICHADAFVSTPHVVPFLSNVFGGARGDQAAL
jgi:hypothetical protein